METRKRSENFQQVVLRSVNKYINEKIQDLRRNKRPGAVLADETEENASTEEPTSISTKTIKICGGKKTPWVGPGSRNRRGGQYEVNRWSRRTGHTCYGRSYETD